MRHTYADIASTSYRIEQSSSDDGGRTWKLDWITVVSRAQETPRARITTDATWSHDFDFNVGAFATRVSRLQHPLTGSTAWLEYTGTSVVRRVWDGLATLIELDVQGPGGRIEGAGLRLYDHRSRQWSLNWASGADGLMTQPMVGEFKDGRGDFVDQESFDERMILARNRFVDITQDSSRFEQEFSADGGRTWETNWVMVFTRVQDAAR